MNPRRAATTLGITLTVVLAGCSSPEPDVATPSATASSASSPTATPSPTATGTVSESPTATPSDASAPAARDLYAAARFTSLAAKNATIEGSVIEEGEAVGILVRGNASGSNQRFDLTAPGKGTVGVVTVKGRFFLTGNDEFWAYQLGPDQVDAHRGKYVEISEPDATERGEFSLRRMLNERAFALGDAAVAKLASPVVATEVSGVPAYRFDLPKGERMFVARDSGVVLRWTRTGASAESLTFSDWGTTALPSLPPSGSILTP